jgi:hypothetical protein
LENLTTLTEIMNTVCEYVAGTPNISGDENIIAEAIQNREREAFKNKSDVDFDKIKSAFGVALHMHQPLIPAGNGALADAEIISNLKQMMDHQDIGDNHNAPVFHQCYKRMGEIIPQLASQGASPRVMLEYSGALLHGLRAMGLNDVFDALKRITCEAAFQPYVEWLGAPWGHAVAPSTPTQDYRLHVRAWQMHFAGIFGLEALQRVRGFSPSEMALPNHPDVAYEFVKTLKDCGYQWVLVQEHTVEQTTNGHTPAQPHIPHRLICQNSSGESASIIAIIKTQGSDTKLVAQMQPYYEAIGLSRCSLGGKEVPPLVTQIADGENGGVMMNEFPPKYQLVMQEATGSSTPAMNVTEYLEYLFSLGINEQDLPKIRPLHQHKIWERLPAGAGPEKLAAIIAELKAQDHQFHMEGGSWTSNLSWVQGYENVLGPMEEVSSLFYEKMIQAQVPPIESRYRAALFHLLSSQTSCYRYWGQGLWTDYGREICRRAKEIILS